MAQLGKAGLLLKSCASCLPVAHARAPCLLGRFGAKQLQCSCHAFVVCRLLLLFSFSGWLGFCAHANWKEMANPGQNVILLAESLGWAWAFMKRHRLGLKH